MKYENWLKWKGREEQRTQTKIPDVSKEIYEQRDRLYKVSGLMEWERKWMVAHDPASSGMIRTMADRHELQEAFGKVDFGNWNYYQKRISDFYRQNGWVFKDGRLSPFKLLDYTKDRDNISTTPQAKIGHKPTDFAGGKEKTLEIDRRREESLARAREKMKGMKKVQ